jgi:DnaK suppressor protein
MNQEHLTYFKNLLEKWLHELLHHADDSVSGLLESETSMPDPLDRAAFEEAHSFKLRILDRESILINKIRQSLADIENGEYGICQICGEDISIARLKARPVAHHCVKCKTEMEAKERLTGT